MITSWWSWIALVAIAYTAQGQSSQFELSIVHINDFHARYEEINAAGHTCSPQDGDICMGGYARTVTIVKQLLASRTNPIYLNAGDNFRGTMWYNIHRWNAPVEFLNMVPADAMTIGSNEFAHGVEGVVPFLNFINSTVLLANVDNRDEPTFHKYQKSLIIERSGRKIGLIGVMSKPRNSNVGNLMFTDVTETVREEAEVLKQQGVNIIVVISHCGIDEDKNMAESVGPEVDIIVGGRSHTFLYTGQHPDIPDVAEGEYPTVVTQQSGHRVLIVQAGLYSKFVGDIVLFFDDAGIIQRWEGNPVYAGANVEPDPLVVEALIPWKQSLDEAISRHVGYTDVDLSDADCRSGECNLGSLIADSMVAAFVPSAQPGHWTYGAIALMPVSDIRMNISKGDINFGNVLDVLPYENYLECVELRGDYLLEVLEQSVAAAFDGDRFFAADMLQVSGLRVKYDINKPIGERVVSLEVLCSDCMTPSFRPLNPFKYYRVITNAYTVAGGKGFLQFSQRGRNKVAGPLDNVALEDYLRQRSPVTQGVDGRIEILI
ncbi:hypothetical protein RP20_CCG013766 [Aedes albopictus]|nr:hypothetical protein RP20_CCG013766 [Aedes albopictus]